MNELELETRLRETLRTVAAATPVAAEDAPAAAMGEPRPRRRPVRAAVAAAALLVAGVAVTLQADRGGDGADPTAPTAPTAVEPGRELPAGFDPATATPVFSAEGGAGPVARAYVQSRFPDWPAPGVTVGDAIEVGAEQARVPWQTGDDSGVVARGAVLLRRIGERWAVVAATTAGLDLSTLSHDGERVRGTVRSTNQNSLFADVLDWRGEPVHRAPRPDGMPGANYRFGTAGGPSDHLLEVDVPHRGAPAVVRVVHVGGTILSIAEVRLEPPPAAPHSDYEACVATGQTVEKEPTPDVVQRRCAAALDGDVLATGIAGDREWALVVSDEPSGRWVTLRSRDQVGTFRFRVADAPDAAATACCAMGDSVVVAGTFAADVTTMRLTTPDGATFEAPAVAVPDGDGRAVRVAILTVPGAGRGGIATLEISGPDGTWRVVDEAMKLAILGG